MTGLLNLFTTELKLHGRDVAGFAFPMLIPVGILVMFGTAYGVSDSTLPAMAVAIALALNALYTVPTALGTYRENGVLRRLSTTPINPATMLLAQLLVHLVFTVVSISLLTVVAFVGFGFTMPLNIVGTLLTFTLGVVGMFAIGGLIAAVTPNAKAASGLGVMLYFPLAYLGGVTLPREMMPQVLAHIGDWTPLGAFRQALFDSWSGVAPAPIHLAIMAVYALVAATAAVRFFRWN